MPTCCSTDRGSPPLLVTAHDAAARLIVGGERYHDAIAWHDANRNSAHRAGRVGENLLAGAQLDAENSVRQLFNHSAFELDDIRVLIRLVIGYLDGLSSFTRFAITFAHAI